jgi:hypothetical protein
MRTLLLSALAALSLATAGCSRNDEGNQPERPRGSTVIEPEIRVDVVPQEEPAVARTQWRAASDTARRVSGNLRVSIETSRGGPVIFAFANGITVRAQPYNMVPADSRSGVGGQSFAAVLGGDPRVNAYLYRVLDENVTASAAQGGLCGEERARYIAVSEFVDGTGRWVFKIAAFRGSEAPPTDDPQLCNSYAYIAQ